MKLIRFILAWILVIFSQVVVANGLNTTPFDLSVNPEKTKVCKVLETESTMSRCLSLSLVNRVELVQQINDLHAARAAGLGSAQQPYTSEHLTKFGGAIFLTPANRIFITQNFGRLSIRNLAFGDVEAIIASGTEKLELPFFVSIYWRGGGHLNPLNGTIYVEGSFHFERMRDIATRPAGDKINLNEVIANLMSVNHISDSKTSSNKTYLRWVESTARTAHFKYVYGMGADVDAKTAELIKSIILPAVIGEALVIPHLKKTLDLVPAAGEVITRSLD